VRVLTSDRDYQFLAASQSLEQQQIQQLLQAKETSERYFRQLADLVPQIVWTVEPSDAISYINQRGRDYLGIDVKAEGAWGIEGFIHPDDLEIFRDRWQQASQTGGSFESQFRVRSATGDYRWFLNRAIALRDADAHIIKWFGTSTDLNEIIQAEELTRLQAVEQQFKLEQRSNRLQKGLLATVSIALVIVSALGGITLLQNRRLAIRAVEAKARTAEAQFAAGDRHLLATEFEPVSVSEQKAFPEKSNYGAVLAPRC
jgi:PAS domain S-box-containing protein